MSPLTLKLDTVNLSDEQFYHLCQNNRELKFERTAKGELRTSSISNILNQTTTSPTPKQHLLYREPFLWSFAPTLTLLL
jgi:hypothetical protein